jgi:hypothetical protein
VNAGVLQGGEIQTVGGDYGYGYYEVRIADERFPGSIDCSSC